MNKMEKIGVKIPEANDILTKKCTEAAISIYGDPLPQLVRERLNKEISAIVANEFSSLYLFGSIVSRKAEELGFKVTTRGKIGSSFVSYLCGISKVNPLPKHYVCVSCHHFETNDSITCFHGYDLPDKNCPICGADMIAEGADLLPEVSMGKELDKEPDIILNIPSSIREDILRYLMDRFKDYRFIKAGINVTLPSGIIRLNVHPGGIYIVPKDIDVSLYTDLRVFNGDNRTFDRNDDYEMPVTLKDYHEVSDVFKIYDFLSFPMLDMLHDLERETCVKTRDIPMNDISIMDVFRVEGFSFIPQFSEYPRLYDVEREILSWCKPNKFSDIVRILGLLTGVNTWNGNGKECCKNGVSIQKLIYSRDVVCSELVKKGIDQDFACCIMNNVSTGRGLTNAQEKALIDIGMPSWYIDSCKSIKYLFPKSHIVEYAMMYFEMAYYYLYYPSEYRHITLDYDLSYKAPF